MARRSRRRRKMGIRLEFVDPERVNVAAAACGYSY